MTEQVVPDDPVLRVDSYSVADLRFDPQNPRLPRHVDGHSSAAVLQWMLTDTTLPELMASIGSQGYFPGEPVLVVPQDTERPHEPPFVVVEGNRRLAAVLLLLHPETAPTRRVTVEEIAGDARYRPDHLPALWYANRDAVLNYLGYRHITGVQEWSPLAKARYLAQLVEHQQRTTGQIDYRDIARKIGSRADYVKRLLNGLAIFDHAEDRGFYEIPNLTEATVDFSLLTTALSYRSISNWVGTYEPTEDEADPVEPDPGRAPVQVDDQNLKDLLDWSFAEKAGGRTVLGESRNLSSLAKVVDTPEAVTALRAGSTLAEATLLTDEPHEIFRVALQEARDGLARARDQLHRIDPDDYDLELATDVVGLARDILTLIRARIEGDQADG